MVNLLSKQKVSLHLHMYYQHKNALINFINFDAIDHIFNIQLLTSRKPQVANSRTMHPSDQTSLRSSYLATIKNSRHEGHRIGELHISRLIQLNK